MVAELLRIDAVLAFFAIRNHPLEHGGNLMSVPRGGEGGAFTFLFPFPFQIQTSNFQFLGRYGYGI